MNVLISACLLGIECRYAGNGFDNKEIIKLSREVCFIPVCPEQLGGLSTPREPSEIKGGSVWNRIGEDVTEAFIKGAKQTCRIAALCDCRYALLKAKSPSCGSKLIYDGTFSGNLKKGQGITASELRKSGVEVFTEEELKLLNNELNKYKFKKD